MATYYLWDGAGGTASGADWTNAFTTLTSALASATASGDVIKVHKAHTDDIAANTTWTMQNHIQIICVDKDNSDALAEMDGSTGYFGNPSTSYSITLQGAYQCFFYGLCFLIGGTGAQTLTLGDTDGHSYVWENCKLWHKSSSSNSACLIRIGKWGSSANSADKLYSCNLWFGHTAHSLRSQGENTFINCTVNSSGAAPTSFITLDSGSPGGGTTIFNGCDLSHITGTLFPNTSVFPYQYFLINCKLGAAVTVLATQTAVGESGSQARVLNSSSGDYHYEFAHYNGLGSTVAVTSPYVSDGALYDGTNHVTWKIVSTANCSLYAPYVSPWIETYHSGTSAITPSLEGLMIDDATVAQNDEVWGEFSYQGTTGYTTATVVNDRMTLLGTAADQTSSKTYSDWTASPVTDSGDSVFKLATTSTITPAEIGFLRARVCVGEASKTIYIDPKIRT